jgi:beta-glucosidase
VPPTLDGNGFSTRYRGDFALYAAHGLTHHRLSIEWARIEPEPGQRDAAAVDHYLDVLRAARDAGIAPWVCVLHFTTPQWFSVEADGFAGDREHALEVFGDHVSFVADTFGDLVAGWQPVNEPLAYVTSYLAEMRPELNDPERVDHVVETVLQATAAAAGILRPTGPTATIHNLSPVFPADASDEAVHHAARWNDLFWRSWNRPDLLQDFDLCGFSYYHATAVDGNGSRLPHPPGARMSEMGYCPWADGFALVLDRLHREQPLPILVAELGIGTIDDTWRRAYLRECLAHLDTARSEGVDVRGCFFWTGVDNYEWLHGYDVPFGLFDRDRTPRESLALVKEHMAAQRASSE